MKKNNTNACRPKTGERYESTKWLNPETGGPLAVKITKIAGGTIYYRPDYGKHDDGSEWLGGPASIDNTAESVGRWLGRKLG